MSDRTAEEIYRTDRATRGRRFSAQVRWAEKLRAAGWTVTEPPEHLRGLTNLFPVREKK